MSSRERRSRNWRELLGELRVSVVVGMRFWFEEPGSGLKNLLPTVVLIERFREVRNKAPVTTVG